MIRIEELDQICANTPCESCGYGNNTILLIDVGLRSVQKIMLCGGCATNLHAALEITAIKGAKSCEFE